MIAVVNIQSRRRNFSNDFSLTMSKTYFTNYEYFLVQPSKKRDLIAVKITSEIAQILYLVLNIDLI